MDSRWWPPSQIRSIHGYWYHYAIVWGTTVDWFWLLSQNPSFNLETPGKLKQHLGKHNFTIFHDLSCLSCKPQAVSICIIRLSVVHSSSTSPPGSEIYCFHVSQAAHLSCCPRTWPSWSSQACKKLRHRCKWNPWVDAYRESTNWWRSQNAGNLALGRNRPSPTNAARWPWCVAKPTTLQPSHLHGCKVIWKYSPCHQIGWTNIHHINSNY